MLLEFRLVSAVNFFRTIVHWSDTNMLYVQWKMMFSGAWSMWKDKINELRKSELNLPPIKDGFMDHLNNIPNKPKFTLTAYSANLFDRPADW
jgi:hypothetical protein